MCERAADPIGDGTAGEQSVGAEVMDGVAWIGRRLRDVRYTIVEGDAVVEGCIVLGPAAAIHRLSEMARATRLGKNQYGLVITGPEYKWPNRTIPYTLAPDLSHPDRVRAAIAHWREYVPRLRFVERTAANDHERNPHNASPRHRHDCNARPPSPA